MLTDHDKSRDEARSCLARGTASGLRVAAYCGYIVGMTGGLGRLMGHTSTDSALTGAP